MMEKKISNNQNISTSILQSGIYFVKVTTADNQIFTEKLIIAK